MPPPPHVRLLTALALLLSCAFAPAQTSPPTPTRDTGGRLVLVLPSDNRSGDSVRPRSAPSAYTN